MRLDESIGLYIEQAKNEEPKQESCCTPIGQIKRYKDCIGCDRKPKQETLEEAAENELSKECMGIINQLFDLTEISVEKRQSINDIADEYLKNQILRLLDKYKQEKMYSEENMRKAFKSSSLTNMLDVYESFEEFIEQFKNK
jgi:molecular chaperone GrpE (heat shock protein)